MQLALDLSLSISLQLNEACTLFSSCTGWSPHCEGETAETECYSGEVACPVSHDLCQVTGYCMGPSVE